MAWMHVCDGGNYCDVIGGHSGSTAQQLVPNCPGLATQWNVESPGGTGREQNYTSCNAEDGDLQ